MALPESFAQLAAVAKKYQLYEKLITQLNKDLKYANIDLQFDSEVLPTSLKLILQESIHHIINEKFSDYLNLLYIVDVPETKVRALDYQDTVDLSEAITFLILQREWQKVWFREKYST